MEKVKIIVAVSSQLYFASEVEVQCHNFRKFGFSSLLQVIVYDNEESEDFMKYWTELAIRYTEVEFFFYKIESIKNLVKVYASVSRPYILAEHWKQYPELVYYTIIYLDSDVLFTRKLDFTPYLQDKICYLSRTNYINSDYFKSKRNDVLTFRLPEYDQIDVLQEFCNVVGISKEIVEENVDKTGGCQCILKEITADFWKDLAKDCLNIFNLSRSLNQRFFSKEERGFQSWALGDMCGLLWNLWKRGKQTSCPPELGFSWADAEIEMYDKHPFFHNAGSLKKDDYRNGKKQKFFCKTDIRFRSNTLTFFDLEYKDISTETCSFKYVEAIKEVPNPICKTNTLLY